MVSVAFFCTYMCLITDMITLPHPSYYRGLGQFVILEEGSKGELYPCREGRGLWERDSLQILDLLRLGSLDNDEWTLGIIKQPS